MGDISTWATGIGLLIAAVFYLRMLRVVYLDGKLDPAAFLVFRSASLRPLFVMVAVLVLCAVAMGVFPFAVPGLLWAMGLAVLAGWIWMAERGIRAVRVSRSA